MFCPSPKITAVGGEGQLANIERATERETGTIHESHETQLYRLFIVLTDALKRT